MTLTRDARHLALPQVGAAGQQRIADGRVLLIGVGGIGYAVGPGEYAPPRPWENLLLPAGLARPTDEAWGDLDGAIDDFITAYLRSQVGVDDAAVAS
mgnify:CR=1 FL=1